MQIINKVIILNMTSSRHSLSPQTLYTTQYLAFMGKLLFAHSMDNTLNKHCDKLGMTPYQFLTDDYSDIDSDSDDDFIRVDDSECIICSVITETLDKKDAQTQNQDGPEECD